MSKAYTKRQSRLFITGLSMGIADLVPGVSGGTIALLFGIYDELLYSIKVITGKVPRLLLQGNFSEAWRVVPFNFLLPVALGIGGAIVVFVSLVTFVLEAFPAQTWSVFFGLIVGSVMIVSRRVDEWNVRRFILLALGALTAYIVTSLPVLSAPATEIIIFGTGAIAICAMVLPGISGSLILVLLGQYETIINAVKSFDLKLLIVFAAGALLGLAVFSRLLSWLLRIHHNATLAVLIGVMIGALRAVWPWQYAKDTHQTAIYLPEINATLLVSFLLGLLGFMLVMKLEKIGMATEHTDIRQKDFLEEVHSQHD